MVVVESNDRWRHHLELLLNEASAVECVGCAPDVASALPWVDSGEAQMVILGFDLTTERPGEMVTQLRDAAPAVQIIAVGYVDQSEALISLLVSGADAVVSKSESSLQVIEAIETVRRGGVHLCVSLARLLVDALRANVRTQRRMDDLSPREMEVLRLLSTGLTDQEIAGRMGIATRTVSTHLQHIYGKLAVHSRAAAIARYLGQLTSPDTAPAHLEMPVLSAV